MALGINAILAGGRPGPRRDCPKPELGKRFCIGQVCKMLVISRDSFRFMELCGATGGESALYRSLRASDPILAKGESK
jgi:hypothetical protein